MVRSHGQQSQSSSSRHVCSAVEELRTLIEGYRAAWERIMRETGNVDEVNQFFHLRASSWVLTGPRRYSAPGRTLVHSIARDWNCSERAA